MKILIINKTPFGYHVDTLKYCQHLGNKFSITYICKDEGLMKIKDNNIHVVYIPNKSNKILSRINFLFKTFFFVKKNKFDRIFIVYSLGSFIYSFILDLDKVILDVRTGDVSLNKYKRIILDNILRIETLFFKNITVISHGLASKLKIKKYKYLPLGGTAFSNPKCFTNDLKLLYVGTFHNRNILECIIGFHNYLIQNDFPKNDKFTLIGNGYNGEREEILIYINQNNLEKYFDLPGIIFQENLSPYFEDANIGISYVPITDYFNFQPPTKTFEYLLSGLFVIATDTFENRNVICKKNGLLIKDNSNDFMNALNAILKVKFNSFEIAEISSNYSWENVINNYLLKYLVYDEES